MLFDIFCKNTVKVHLLEIFKLYKSLFIVLCSLLKVGGWVPVKSNITHKSEMRVEMTGITWPGNTVLPPLGKPEKRFMRIATLKEKPYVFYVDRDANGKCVPPAVPCRVMKEKIVL